MDDINQAMPIFFPETKYAEGLVYEGGKTYALKKTSGTIDRWIRRGCSFGKMEDALPDPRFPKEVQEKKIVEKEVVKEEKKEEKPRLKPRRRKSKEVNSSEV